MTAKAGRSALLAPAVMLAACRLAAATVTAFQSVTLEGDFEVPAP
jgi:hypothetical protein